MPRIKAEGSYEIYLRERLTGTRILPVDAHDAFQKGAHVRNYHVIKRIHIYFYLFVYVMLHFFTFCVDIGKHSKSDLQKALHILVHSIHCRVPSYKVICYTNFPCKTLNGSFHVEFREYYDKQAIKLYTDKWLNLSFNKINVYKDLHDEYAIDYTWIDLDTIITSDVSYLNDASHFFIETGGDFERANLIFSNNSTMTCPRNRSLLGNVWKLNIQLYDDLMTTLHELIEKKLRLQYDLQSLFTYHIYVKKKCPTDFNILGLCQEKIMYGLDVWSPSADSHPTHAGLNQLYYDGHTLKSKYHGNKEIHILSFVFYPLKRMWNTEKFKSLFENHVII
jgi:hypothetical protein